MRTVLWVERRFVFPAGIMRSVTALHGGAVAENVTEPELLRDQGRRWILMNFRERGDPFMAAATGRSLIGSIPPWRCILPGRRRLRSTAAGTVTDWRLGRMSLRCIPFRVPVEKSRWKLLLLTEATGRRKACSGSDHGEVYRSGMITVITQELWKVTSLRPFYSMVPTDSAAGNAFAADTVLFGCGCRHQSLNRFAAYAFQEWSRSYL